MSVYFSKRWFLPVTGAQEPAVWVPESLRGKGSRERIWGAVTTLSAGWQLQGVLVRSIQHFPGAHGPLCSWWDLDQGFPRMAATPQERLE